MVVLLLVGGAKSAIRARKARGRKKEALFKKSAQKLL
jgi:hypothetical protein